MSNEVIDMDLPEIFDSYILKFLDNFPMIEIEKTIVSKTELLVSIKIKEPEYQEYSIHIKKKE